MPKPWERNWNTDPIVAPVNQNERRKEANDAAASDYAVPQAQVGLQKTQADMARDARNEQRTVEDRGYQRGQDAAKRRADLRQEFNALPTVRNYQTVASKIASALQAPKGPAGDLAILYAFATVMDPNSAVRESEQEMARSVGTKMAALKQEYNMSKAGAELPPGVRDQLLEAMRNNFRTVHDLYSSEYNRYVDIARTEGHDPKQVVGRYLGEIVAPVEEEYIRNAGGVPKKRDGVTLYNPEVDAGGPQMGPNGRVDYGNMSAGGNAYNMEAAGAGASSRSVFNAEKSAMIDRLVRRGVPYAEANRQIQARFPGSPQLPQGDYNGAIAHARENPGYKGSYGFATDQQPMGFIEQRLNDYSHMPEGAFVANAANAFTGGLPSFLAGDQGQLAMQTMRAENPRASLAGEVTGAVGGSLLAGGAINRAGSAIGGRFGAAVANNPGRVAVAGDTAYGGIYGATQNPDNPGLGFAMGAGAAVGGNLAGRYLVAPGIKAAASTPLADGLRASLGRAAAPQGLDRGQALAYDAVTSGNGVDAARANLQDAIAQGLPYSLADSSPEVRRVAGSAVRFSPTIERYARENLAPIGLGQQARAINAVDTNLARSGNVGEMVNASRTAGQNASRPFYEAAMQQPVVDDPVIREILNTPAGAKAARKAYDMALNEGRSPAELGMSIDSLTGEVRWDAVPNWQALQYVKFGLDSVIKDNSDALGRLDLTDRGNQILNQQRATFTERLGQLNPDFARGNAAYAAERQIGSAAESGYASTADNVRPDDMARAYGALPQPQQQSFQRGFASSLVDKISNQGRGRNPTALYNSEADLAKMGTLFPEGSQRFNRFTSLEDDMRLTRQETLGGSATQPRAVADGQFGNGAIAIGGDLLASSIGAPPTNIPGMVAGHGIRGAAQWGTERTRRGVADRIGQALLEPNPQSAMRFLDDLDQMARAREAWARRYNQAGSTIGAATGLGLLATR